jgi:NADP-dependent 3-hydroxy acid dehydrogenase YdfG
MRDLSGKVALVTGASSGIGNAVALALAAEGAHVAVAGRRRNRLDDLVGKITASGGRGLAVIGDVSVLEDAARFVRQTVENFGRIDILINSAGINEAGGVELPVETWRHVLNVNLMGSIYTSRAAFSYMKAQGAGDIVNISSTAGRRAASGFASYSTSKFGLTGFTEALRQEAGSVGVRVAIVEPGSTATEIANSISDPGVRKQIHDHTHKEGVMEASDIAAAILLIVSLPRRANVTRILIQPTIDVAPMP